MQSSETNDGFLNFYKAGTVFNYLLRRRMILRERMPSNGGVNVMPSLIEASIVVNGAVMCCKMEGK